MRKALTIMTFDENGAELQRLRVAPRKAAGVLEGLRRRGRDFKIVATLPEGRTYFDRGQIKPEKVMPVTPRVEPDGLYLDGVPEGAKVRVNGAVVDVAAQPLAVRAPKTFVEIKAVGYEIFQWSRVGEDGGAP